MKRINVLVVAAVLWTGMAHATFEVVDSRSPSGRIDEAAALGVVTQIGYGAMPAQAGMGRNLPLDQAMRLLLPEGWRFVPNPDLPNPAVSWGQDGGVDWGEALEAIGLKEGLRFVIDWHKHRVYGAMDGSQIAGNADDDAAGASPGQVKAPVWRLEPGSLKAQLEEWVILAGYRSLVWAMSDDILLDAGAVLTGDFEAAVAQVFAALRSRGAAVRPEINRGNRVLVVFSE